MTIRIDFGRLFPGVVVLLVGIAFFVLWLLLVFVSFFAFFVPGLEGLFYVALDVLVVSVVLMGCGGLLMLAGVSGWRQMGGGAVVAQTEKDRMSPGERAGEVVGLFVSFLVLLFFVENQVRDTGFFTSRFGPTEQALFYGTWLVGAAVGLARAAYGRRNAVRPFDALNGALLAATAYWLFTVFPFDFTHFPDLIPGSVRFLFSWASNEVGYIVIVLAGFGGFVSLLYNTFMYAAVRSRQHLWWSEPAGWRA